MYVIVLLPAEAADNVMFEIGVSPTNEYIVLFAGELQVTTSVLIVRLNERVVS